MNQKRKRPTLQTIFSPDRSGDPTHSNENLSNTLRPVLKALGGVGIGTPEGLREGDWPPNPTGIRELLSGWLPESQMETIRKAGFPDLIFGTNQSAIKSLEECQEYLEKHDGINITGYNSWQRLLLADHTYSPDWLKKVIEEGYFGKRGGLRMVVVFPMKSEARDTFKSMAAENPEVLWMSGFTPEDIFGGEGTTVTGMPKSIVPSKYVSGLVDDSGRYLMNPGFLQGSRS